MMFPTVKERRKNAPFFHKYYTDLCKLHNVVPITFTKREVDQNVLDVYGDRVKIDEWLSILEALKNDRSLHSIAVRSKYPVKKVLEEVDSEVKVRKVPLRKTPVLYSRFILHLLVVSVAECISESSALTCLELEGLPLKLEYISVLSNSFSANRSLQTISFHGSCIGDESCEKLCFVIKDMNFVFHLDLSGCNISSKGAAHVAAILKYQSLQRYSEGWKHSLRYQDPNLESMPGLRRIILNNNTEIGDEGVQYISEVLKEDIWLKAIDLQDCGISNVGAECVLCMLDINKTLYIVDVRDNKAIDDALSHQIMLKLLYNNANENVQEYNWTIPQSQQSGSKSIPVAQRGLLKQNVLVKCSVKQKRIWDMVPINVCEMEKESSSNHYVSQLMATKEKLQEVVNKLATENYLRRKAESEREKLMSKITELENELLKEKKEKEGFCLVKVEAYEVILETLRKCSAFLENIKKAKETSNTEDNTGNKDMILEDCKIEKPFEAYNKQVEDSTRQEESVSCPSFKKNSDEGNVPIDVLENQISQSYYFDMWGNDDDDEHNTGKESQSVCNLMKQLIYRLKLQDKSTSYSFSLPTSVVLEARNMLESTEGLSLLNNSEDS